MPRSGVKEQDRLVSEPDSVAEIAKAVRKLQEFEAYLDGGFRQTISSAEGLANLSQLRSPTLRSKATALTRVWQPLFCHALQPAQYFRGRVVKLQELKNWLRFG
jgi:hypothetical protein